MPYKNYFKYCDSLEKKERNLNFAPKHVLTFSDKTFIWLTNSESSVLSIGYIETKYIKLKTKNQKPNFLLLTFRLFYTLLKKGEKKNFFPFQKTFSCPPFSKVYKKSREIFIYTNINISIQFLDINNLVSRLPNGRNNK